MNPFIALAGICLTFSAFYMQYQANQIQVKALNKNQAEQTRTLQEQMFFRLMDELKQKLIHFSFGNHSSYEALDNMISDFRNCIEDQFADLGRKLFIKTPEKIEISHYRKIIEAIYGENNSVSTDDIKKYAQELKDSIVEIPDCHNRSEYIKNNYTWSTGLEKSEKGEVLKSIGRVHFYKIDFEWRKNIYKICYQDIYAKYRGFMDSYIKNFKYLIDFVIAKKNKDFTNYLRNLSNQELIFIFYYCASEHCSNKFRKDIKEINLLANLDFSVNDRFADWLLLEDFKSEIENVLKEAVSGIVEEDSL